MFARRVFAYALGSIEALLLARLLLRLLAARPDNPVVAVVYGITPRPGFLINLDRGQPRFGATLELSTLALFLLLLVVGSVIGRLWATYDHTRQVRGGNGHE